MPRHWVQGALAERGENGMINGRFRVNLIQVKTEPDGARYWYRNGLRHREDGPAVERPNGTKFWFRNGLRHREDGPAVEYPDGSKYWYRNGQLHREDGPAIEFPDGDEEHWLNGERVFL